jgi:hypothetical protein
MSVPYPGNVNQPDRRDPDWEQYHTFEQTVNHELPDMRHEWKDDSRDDIGFGIPEANPPTVASVRVAANKAVRVAVLLLGEKVDDDVIEAQARDFMSLSQEAMDRTLDRFAKSQALYAEDDDEDEDEKKEDKKASKELADKASEVPAPVKAPDKADEKKAEDKADEKKEEKKAEDKAEDKKEEKKEAKSKKSDDEDEAEEKKEAKSKKSDDEDEAEDKKEEKKEAKSKKSEDKKEMPEFIKEKIEESKKDKKADEDDDEEEKDEDKSKKADEDDDEEEKDEKKEAKVAGPNEMDIELTSAADEEVEPDPEADAQLASLFDDGLTAKQEEQPKAASSKKAGIKKLGGQPKVAAEDAAPVDISSIWDSAPDVSQLFK